MKKYEKPTLTVVELKTESLLLKASGFLPPDCDDDFSEIEDGVILPENMVWD